MRVQDLMSHPVITCDVNDNLNTPVKLMWEHDCGVIPVVREDGKLAGILTDRDICMAAYTHGRSLDQILVNAVMTKHVFSVHPEVRISEAIRLMTENHIRRIPVVDALGKPVGVLSINDLAIESIQPDTRMKHAFANIAHAVAAVCRPRTPRRHAT